MIPSDGNKMEKLFLVSLGTLLLRQRHNAARGLPQKPWCGPRNNLSLRPWCRPTAISFTAISKKNYVLLAKL